MTARDILAFSQDQNVLLGAEGMPSTPLDHDCLIFTTPHMHCCGETGALVTELETGIPSMRKLVYACAVWISFRRWQQRGHMRVERV
jgi:hypothetical protein